VDIDGFLAVTIRSGLTLDGQFSVAERIALFAGKRAQMLGVNVRYFAFHKRFNDGKGIGKIYQAVLKARGTWVCAHCETKNKCKDTRCSKTLCMVARGSALPPKAPWTCECKKVNAGNRVTCAKCSKRNPDAKQEVAAARWRCQNCSFQNSATTNTCTSCFSGYNGAKKFRQFNKKSSPDGW
jgi:hypothetical protein